MGTVLVPPVSKSDAQRALVLAWSLGVAPPVLHDEPPRDVDVLHGGLQVIDRREGRIDCRDGGAPFRFLVTQAALTPGARIEFVGTERLAARPHEPLLVALEAALGLRLQRGSPWPLVVETPKELPAISAFRVDGAQSSQFVSSLLLGAARVAQRSKQPVRVEWADGLASVGYVELTLEWLRRFGSRVEREPNAALVGPAASVTAVQTLPGDWSSLTYLLALGWKKGVPIADVDLGATHPDRSFARVLEAVGLELATASSLTTVSGVPMRGFDVDAAECPDAAPTLAALSSVLPQPSTLRNIGILRGKESDRVDGILRLLGPHATLDGDTLRLTPGLDVARLAFDARDDHRLAMAATTLAVLNDRALTLRGASSVVKSFPTFWSELRKLGFVPEAL